MENELYCGYITVKLNELLKYLVASYSHRPNKSLMYKCTNNAQIVSIYCEFINYVINGNK